MTLHQLLVATLVAAPVVVAPPERVTIRIVPSPGQVLHTHSTQEMVMDIEPAASSDAVVAMPKMTMSMTLTSDGNVTVSAANEQGRYDARIVMDVMSNTITMNGQPMPTNVPMPEIKGLDVTFTYDREGRLVDVAGGQDLPGFEAALDFLKRMLTTMPGLTAPIALAVGETATVPSDMALPIPAGNGGSMALKGDMTYTLTSIAPEGADRIAHLATVISTRMNSSLPMPAGPGGVALGMNMQMTGDGTTDLNVDRGFVKAGEQRMTIEGTMTAVSSTKLPALHMHGTMKVSTTTETR